MRLIGDGLCQSCSQLPNLAFKIEAQLARKVKPMDCVTEGG